MGSKPEALTLGDYFEMQRGTTYKSSLLGQPGPFLLGLATIQRNGGFRSDSLKVYGGASPEKLLVRPGEMYVSLKDVTQSADLLGAVARFPEHFGVGRLTQDTVKLTPVRKDVPLSFLYWLLRTPQYRSYCKAHGTGTTNLGLSREDFFAFQVPEATKRRLQIVEVLESTDQKSAVLDKSSATLEAMARAHFKSWFIDFDPVRAKAAGKKTGLPKEIEKLFPSRLVKSELGEVPEGWVTKTLGDVALVTKGRSYKSDELVDSDTALVTLKSFARGGGYRLDGLKSFSGTYKPEQVVSSGDIVVACTDVTQAAEVIGRPALVRSSSKFKTLVGSLDTLIVRAKDSKAMSREFLYFLMSRQEFTDHTYSYVTGTTVLHLSKEAVPTFKFVCAPKEISHYFGLRIGAIMKNIDVNEAQSSNLSEIRNSLLTKLF